MRGLYDKRLPDHALIGNQVLTHLGGSADIFVSGVGEAHPAVWFELVAPTPYDFAEQKLSLLNIGCRDGIQR